MPPSLKFIKKVNYKSTANLLDILKSYIVGNTDIKEYTENKMYMKDELIIRLNQTTNKYEVLKCNSDNTTGVFNANSWTLNIPPPINFDDAIIVSETQPENTNNKIWFELINYKT